jgi:hypothetical protein
MWCLIYIAIASSAPPTDCSLLSEIICQTRAARANNLNWREDIEKIPYLVQCVSSLERAKYFQARLVEKVMETNQ